MPGLKHLYLEDSWVLGIEESPDELRFDLEAVLTEDHPRWSTPKPDEQYAYLPIALVFRRPRTIEFERSRCPPAVDATGEIDYGHIDSFQWEGCRFELEGDWGSVRIEGDPPAVIER